MRPPECVLKRARNVLKNRKLLLTSCIILSFVFLLLHPSSDFFYYLANARDAPHPFLDVHGPTDRLTFGHPLYLLIMWTAVHLIGPVGGYLISLFALVLMGLAFSDHPCLLMVFPLSYFLPHSEPLNLGIALFLLGRKFKGMKGNLLMTMSFLSHEILYPAVLFSLFSSSDPRDRRYGYAHIPLIGGLILYDPVIAIYGLISLLISLALLTNAKDDVGKVIYSLIGTSLAPNPFIPLRNVSYAFTILASARFRKLAILLVIPTLLLFPMTSRITPLTAEVPEGGVVCTTFDLRGLLALQQHRVKSLEDPLTLKPVQCRGADYYLLPCDYVQQTNLISTDGTWCLAKNGADD